MLYEVITDVTIISQGYDQADFEGMQRNRARDGRMRRITSYNVCYTKLLRLMEREAGVDHTRSPAFRIERIDGEGRTHTVFRQEHVVHRTGDVLAEDHARDFDAVGDLRLVADRITSYNVCYTKLLRTYAVDFTGRAIGWAVFAELRPVSGDHE